MDPQATISIIFSSLCAIVLGQDLAYTKFTYPNIFTDRHECGRSNRSTNAAVCDPGRVLTEERAAELDQEILNLREMRSCICDFNCEEGPYPYSFVKIAIAIIPEIEGGQDSTDERQATVKSFATYLRSVGWRFGSCDDDIVIALAVKERHLQTSIGTKVEERMSTECVIKIFEKHKEDFSNGYYYSGLKSLIEAYTKVLNGEDEICKTGLPWWAWLLISLGCAVPVLCCCWCCCCGKCKGGSGRSSSGGGFFDGGFFDGGSGGGGGGFGGGGGGDF